MQKKLSESILAGAKITRPHVGSLFGHGDADENVLCACAMGAALVGAGHLNGEVILAALQNGGYARPWANWDQAMARYFVGARDPLPDAMWEEVCRRWPGRFSWRRPTAIADLVINLNDDALASREEIAQLLMKYGY